MSRRRFAPAFAAFLALACLVRPAALRADSLSRYERRQEVLFQQASREQSVAYGTFLPSIYDPARLADILESKADYRDWVTARFPVFADYERISEAVPVARDATRVMKDGMTEAATYFVAEDRIVVRTDDRPGRSLLHEAGHALQHVRLAALGRQATVCDRRLTRLAPKERNPRLEYLLQQAELEVRLQDLNRLYAYFHAGVPILTPQDSICALGMLRAGVDARDIERALADANVSWPPGASEPLLRQWPRDDDATRLAFADAFTLAELLRISRQRSPELYSVVLMKLIFEAPAHL